MHKFITPRVGSDNAVCYSESMFFDFNPRSPCGERLLPGFSVCANCIISIHAPRVGSDKSTKEFVNS